MIKTNQHPNDVYHVIEYRPERPMTTKPNIVKTVREHGVKIYKDDQGKRYYADQFDKMFKCKKGKVKKLYYKGENPDKKRIIEDINEE